jgi:hypothetical protein
VSRAVTQLVTDGRQQAVLRFDDLFAGVEDQEVACAIGVLCFSPIECGLAEGGRLLVAENARDGYLAQER